MVSHGLRLLVWRWQWLLSPLGGLHAGRWASGMGNRKISLLSYTDVTVMIMAENGLSAGQLYAWFGHNNAA